MLKEFIKSVSIYGISPIIGKFIGLFLIPVYTRVLIPAEFGALDIYMAFAHFASALIGLELYTGVGRHYYDSDKINNKQKLISSGFWFIIINSFLFTAVLLALKNSINSTLIGTQDHIKAYYLLCFWLPFSVIFAFLSVMMRYEKKPGIFILIINLQLILRVAITILLVVFLKVGIKGVFWGHLSGALLGTLLLIFYFRKAIIFNIDKTILKKILLFSVPMIPAIFLLRFHNIISRYLMKSYLSLSDIGLFAVGIKLVSIFVILRFGFRMAWGPFLFEQIQKPEYKQKVIKIYNFFSITLGFTAFFIILFAKEIIKLITGKEFWDAYIVVGFLSINAILWIITQIIGIGPQIQKKTYYYMIQHGISLVALILFMLFLVPTYGLYGVGVSFLISGIINLITSWIITSKLVKIDFPKRFIILMIVFLTVANILTIQYQIPLLIKMISFSMITLIIFLNYRGKIGFLIRSRNNIKNGSKQ